MPPGWHVTTRFRVWGAPRLGQRAALLGVVLLLGALVVSSPGAFAGSFGLPGASTGARGATTGSRLSSFGASDLTVGSSPSSARVGDYVNVTGSGFLPTVEIDLFLNDSTSSTVLPECPSNASGDFSCAIQVPGISAGSYDLNASDNVNNATAAFLVLAPSLTLEPSAGIAGTNVTVNGTGFARRGMSR